MYVIHADNPDEALLVGLQRIFKYGITTESRNGPVIRFPRPVTTEWMAPMQRVSFNSTRDANPFLHLMESLWMLNGNNDVATMGYYAKQMLAYSDDGQTLNGAYGYRWRTHFDYDQLDAVIAELRKNPSSRRCVISMWNGMDNTQDMGAAQQVRSDLLNQNSKDLPCNTAVYVDAGLGKVDITVTNRSNDMIWGAYGANAVHFAFLQEYIANKIGLPVGTYYQMSNNLHVYTDFEITKRFVKNGVVDLETVHYMDLYTWQKVAPLSLHAESEGFDGELATFVANCTTMDTPIQFNNSFLQQVAVPMTRAYNIYKKGDKESALALLTYSMQALCLSRELHANNDWLQAGVNWINRRINK